MALVVPESSLGEDAAALVEQAADPAPTPEEAALRRSDADRVRAAIEAIPEPFREAVVLRDLEDLSYAEIAEVTGVPVGTVMSRLARGRAMLAKQLLPGPGIGDVQSRSVK
jgi:RNA polymerase sigma-70 factor (ECF subfamily)